MPSHIIWIVTPVRQRIYWGLGGIRLRKCIQVCGESSGGVTGQCSRVSVNSWWEVRPFSGRCVLWGFERFLVQSLAYGKCFSLVLSSYSCIVKKEYGALCRGVFQVTFSLCVPLSYNHNSYSREVRVASCASTYVR